MAELIRMFDHGWNEEVEASPAPLQFQEQDVELLLDEAADLLDRVLKDKAEFDLLGEKLFELGALEKEKETLNSTVSIQLPMNHLPYSLKPGSFVVKDLANRALVEDYDGRVAQLTRFTTQLKNVANIRAMFSGPNKTNSMEFAGVANSGTNDPADKRYTSAKEIRLEQSRSA